jgi:hypothetical protein
MGGHQLSVITEHPEGRQHQRSGDRTANVVDGKAAIEQPSDQLRALLARLAFEAVKQAQRLDIEVRHSVNTIPRRQPGGHGTVSLRP